MTLDDLLQEIYALEEEMRVYERKYGVLSETFYESYNEGEEPAHEAWVRDWTAWASAYRLWLRRRQQYKSAIQRLRAESSSVADVIEEPLAMTPFQSLRDYEIFVRPVSHSPHPTCPS